MQTTRRKHNDGNQIRGTLSRAGRAVSKIGSGLNHLGPFSVRIARTFRRLSTIN
jgi:hypothetical protein